MIQKSVGSSPAILVCLILMLGYQFMIQTKIRSLKKNALLWFSPNFIGYQSKNCYNNE